MKELNSFSVDLYLFISIMKKLEVLKKHVATPTGSSAIALF
jgi:hypothetical protein